MKKHVEALDALLGFLEAAYKRGYEEGLHDGRKRLPAGTISIPEPVYGAEARQLAIDAGILTKKGNLRKRYK